MKKCGPRLYKNYVIFESFIDQERSNTFHNNKKFNNSDFRSVKCEEDHDDSMKYF